MEQIESNLNAIYLSLKLVKTDIITEQLVPVKGP